MEMILDESRQAGCHAAGHDRAELPFSEEERASDTRDEPHVRRAC
jgi:hypothetical protein